MYRLSLGLGPGFISTRFFLLFFYLLFLDQFYPGTTSSDSCTQIEMIIHHAINDWHAPLMTWLWQQLFVLYPGSQLFFLWQSTVVFLALAVIIDQFPVNNLLLCLFFLYPPIYSVIGQFTKDSFFVVNMLAGFALILMAKRTGRHSIFFLALLAIGLACDTRHESWPATVPMFIWYFSDGKWLKTLAVSLVVAILPLWADNLLDDWIVRDQGGKTHPVQQLYITDLLGFSLSQNTILFPPEMLAKRVISIDDFAERIKQVRGDGYGAIMGGPQLPPLIHIVRNTAVLEKVKAEWIKQIVHHPGEYLKFHGRLYCDLLGFGEIGPYSPYSFATKAPVRVIYGDFDFPYTKQVGVVTTLVGALYLGHAHELWFTPFGALALSGFLLTLIIAGHSWGWAWSHAQSYSVALCGSALCHAAIFFIAISGSNYRFGFWMFFSSMLAALLFIGCPKRGTKESNFAAFAPK